MATVIATGLIGLVSTDKRGVSMAIRFSFFFAQKTVNVHNGVKNAFIYCVFRTKWTIFDKKWLTLQPLAASSVVGRRSWHTYKWRLLRLTILLSKTRTFRRNRSGQKPRSSSVGSSKCRCYVGMITPYGIAMCGSVGYSYRHSTLLHLLSRYWGKANASCLRA